MGLISYDEVAKHNNSESCYVIVHGKVYDVTEFLPEHPGGSKIILKYAGKDATEEYDPIHPPGTLEENLPKDKCLGEVDPATMKAEAKKEESQEEKQIARNKDELPPLDLCLNLYDFEVVARKVLKGTAWAYYSSGADDEVTMRENNNAFGRIWFRPRILRDVSNINYSTSLLGCKSTLPIYITATALGKLGHPDGEKNLTIAAGREGIIQMIPTLASCSFEEIVDARVHDQQPQFFQLYVNSNRAITEKLIRRAEERGVKGLFVTVDAPQLGRREKDMRIKFEDVGSRVQNDGKDDVDRSQGAARAISSFIDPSLNWDDLNWLRSVTRMPIVLKGVQTWEDAVKAAELGLSGVVLSNHGGRQLDFARSGIEVLGEVVEALKQRGLFPNPMFQIFVDGGVRRASDVLKAVAMGATACGIGRPFLYAYSAYGPEGVQRAIQLLKAEMEMNMRLIGAPTLKDLEPNMVDVRALSTHVNVVPESNQAQIYERLSTAVGMPNEPANKL
ncbi:putative CYB2-L-lactate dehydrogenase [Tilletiopsis washingtonensis]|uniref:L-lactate dehydrogenase (cytochrome) n=1 Tax=Tilletiopsis washingtonensis TaxID=58919 RepID=A0A316Z8J0_9BASI|nr:putative CYB2-L-lactate dehydrogenase [Tilletiopsis washingtonensis]PWN97576.1 putative CYB2-L-lactate dehydrogenase [Tilletiopsis washingtonensis]